jgi:hypothetical protein
MMLRTLKVFLNLKIILAGIIFGLIIFAVLVGLLWSSRGKMGSQIPATAMLSVIDAPTETPLAPAVTPTPATTPTPTQQEPMQGGNIAIGDYVQVSGTGGEGLRLHTSAGISSDVRYIAIEAEVFIVKDGPVDADGYIWWLLQDPYSDNATGWGAANYLVVVQNPASN